MHDYECSFCGEYFDAEKAEKSEGMILCPYCDQWILVTDDDMEAL